MPNSYFGDRIKKISPRRIDTFHIPHGDFVTVTGSGYSPAFGDKATNLY